MAFDTFTGLGRRMLNHPGGQNFLWLAGDKGLRMVVGLVVGSWIARYLGASDFGLFAYAAAWIAIVAGLAGLGMDAMVVRDIISRPSDTPVLLGTIVVCRLVASLVGSLLILGAVCVIRPHEPRVWGLVALLAFGTIVQSLEATELWFQARVQMRRLVLPRLAVFALMNVLKVWLVIKGADLVAFVGLSAVEMAVGGLLTYVLVRTDRHGPGRFAWHGDRAGQLLAECWPLAVSGLVVILYMKIAPLLLAGLLDDAALGIYAAATRVSESANFLPMILASSLLPSLLHSRERGAASYAFSRLRYFRINALIAYVLCLVVAVGAPWIVRLLYGGAFPGATKVLVVHVWALVPVFMGVARGQHLLNERQTRWSLRFTIWGLLINVALSLLLIPRFGPVGAAWAVVLAYATSAIGTSFIFPATRELGREQLLALFTPWKAFTFHPPAL